MNEGKRLISVFVNPKGLFEDLRENPRWLIPFIIIPVVIAVATLLPRLLVPYDVWLETARQNLLMHGAEVSEEFLPMIVERMRAPLANILQGVIVNTIFILIATLGYWAAYAVSGAKVNFRKSFSIVTYTGLIPALGALLISGLMSILGTLDINASLAVLPFLEPGGFLYRLAGYIAFFAVWRVLVLSEGFHVVAGIKRGLAFVIGIGVWIVGFFGLELLRWIPRLIFGGGRPGM